MLVGSGICTNGTPNSLAVICAYFTSVDVLSSKQKEYAVTRLPASNNAKRTLDESTPALSKTAASFDGVPALWSKTFLMSIMLVTFWQFRI
jgi:uncharacterized membrane protein